ncbi:dual specificity protein phosphatase family protein [Seleniivibrio woodruffii]|uniref:dual specificity protein phosphatase family protein n=1 Tax=Seleniivibrio woodruffii TaxID=1078050 RepID=UPI0026EACED3|nr:dual specificity protein phosphatase family protein [Seleniivibrio woodruffii]
MLIIFLFFIYQKYINHNFHIVEKDALYRSAQPTPEILKKYKERYGIRSVISLRRARPDKEWYRKEIAASQDLGLAHYDVALSSTMPAPMEKMEELAQILKTAERPMLIHCLGGSDRTGLGVALYLYTVKNQSPEEALEQSLSIFYGHFPYLWMKTDAMTESFLRYTKNN